MYDFRQCKLCGEEAASPRYRLPDLTVHACARCDFHYSDRLDPSEADESPLHDRGRRYMESRMADGRAALERRIELIRSHRPLEGARCLDVGAGVGTFLRALCEEGASARGIEPSRVRRAFARERFGLELDARTLESGWWGREHPESFDLLTLWDVLEHLNFPVQTVREAARVLKPGGLIFVETPSRDVPAYRLSHCAYRLSGGRIPLFLPNFYSSAPFGHKQIFRPAQLLHLLETTGFEILLSGASRGETGKNLLIGARKKTSFSIGKEHSP